MSKWQLLLFPYIYTLLDVIALLYLCVCCVQVSNEVNPVCVFCQKNKKKNKHIILVALFKSLALKLTAIQYETEYCFVVFICLALAECRIIWQKKECIAAWHIERIVSWQTGYIVLKKIVFII